MSSPRLPTTNCKRSIEDPVAENDKTGERLRTLADRLDIAAKHFETIQAKAGSSLKGLIIAAALMYRS